MKKIPTKSRRLKSSSRTRVGKTIKKVSTITRRISSRSNETVFPHLVNSLSSPSDVIPSGTTQQYNPQKEESKPSEIINPTIHGIDLFQLPLLSIISFSWSWLWRVAIYTAILVAIIFVCAVAVGIIFGILFQFINVPTEVRTRFFNLSGYFLAIVGSFIGFPFYLRWVTTRRIGRFRLTLHEEIKQ